MGLGLLKKGPQAIGKSRGGWNTKIHLVAANARTAITFCLSPGQDHDGPVGRQLLLELGPMPVEVPLVMDRAYSRPANTAVGVGVKHDSGGTPENRIDATLATTTANCTRNRTKWSASFVD
jgi:hypothetical protein